MSWIRCPFQFLPELVNFDAASEVEGRLQAQAAWLPQVACHLRVAII